MLGGLAERSARPPNPILFIGEPCNARQSEAASFLDPNASPESVGLYGVGGTANL